MPPAHGNLWCLKLKRQNSWNSMPLLYGSRLLDTRIWLSADGFSGIPAHQSWLFLGSGRKPLSWLFAFQRNMVKTLRSIQMLETCTLRNHYDNNGGQQRSLLRESWRWCATGFCDCSTSMFTKLQPGRFEDPEEDLSPAIDVCCDVFNDFQPSQPTLTSSPIGNGCYFFGFMDPATVARDTSKMAINLDGVW